MSDKLSLIPIGRDGTPLGYSGELTDMAREVVHATVGLYETAGFTEPWIGYFAVQGTTLVGTCAFKSPPSDGRVEIAYGTFSEFEGQGVATSMARKMVAIAVSRAPELVVAAQTLPEPNASHRILEKIGFRHVSTPDHPDDGEVWEWQLQHIPRGSGCESHDQDKDHTQLGAEP